MVVDWTRRELGIVMDPWQVHALTSILRYDRHGDVIARTALVSTGRQNGKSVIVRGLYGWMLDEGHKLEPFREWTEIIAAAHDAKQARLIYHGVYRDLQSIPRLAEANKGPRQGRPVRLTEHFGITMDGLTLDTVTGQPGSARGHSAGAVAWDEVLTQTDWRGYEALAPVQTAQRSPIMLVTSTAGFAESVVLRSFYDRLVRIARKEEKPDPTFYGAWWQSQDPDAGLDWRAVAEANPSFGHGRRLTRRGLASEHAILPPDSWRRERLNHWVDTVAAAAFNPAMWRKLHTPDPLAGLEGPFDLGVDVQPGWERASVYVAGVRPDGRVGVEPWRDLRAADGPLTAQTIIDAVMAFPRPRRTVSYEAVIGPAGELGRHGENDWGVEWRALKPNQVLAACIDTMQLVQGERIAVADPLLDAQIPMVALRPVGQDGAYRWSRALSSGPIDAVFAMTFAVSAAVNAQALPAVL
jgi:hypothetical protein